MARQIIWSEKVQQEIRDIHDYWVERTGSEKYTIKLEESFFKAADSLESSPYQGKLTKAESIRYLIVKYHKLFYTVQTDEIVILSVFDTRRDPDKTPF